jgi:hypothetical protein
MKIMRKLVAGLTTVILIGSTFGSVSLSQAAPVVDSIRGDAPESIRGLETA